MRPSFDLRASTVLLTLAGSRASGLEGPASDVDLKGVALPPAEYYLGFLHRFEQADDPESMATYRDLLTPDEREAAARTKLEGSVYELRKFVTLAAEGNPNLLDVLFCRDQEVRLCTPLGRALRDRRNDFLSTRLQKTFSGYATAQVRRIRGQGRDYDTKHAAHLVRLLRMGREILTTGRVWVWRGPSDEPGAPGDRDELLAIRAGAWGLDEVVAWADRQDRELSELVAAGGCAVPDAVDLDALDRWCVSVVRASL